MLKAYKYRIYPNSWQQIQIDKTMDVCRYVYNIGLETKISAWQAAGISLSAYDLQKQLTDAKNEFPWLREVASNALQAALANLEQNFKSFYRGGGFPKYKTKRGRQSFHCKNNTKKIDFEKGLLSISRIKNIPIVISRSFQGEIRNIIISRAATGKYFASILVKNEEPPRVAPAPQQAIGIDLGVSSFASLSTGEKVDNPKYLSQSLNRLRVLSQRASKKKRHSKNQQRAFRKIALLHEKISNQRADFLHKTSSKLIRDSQADTICIESLNIDGLIKNRKLSKSISDASWGDFIRMLEYKAAWYGKNIIRIGQFYASSKTCSVCGFKSASLPLRIREWICENCGVLHDRDINAAINIKIEGLNISGRETPEEPVELPYKGR